MNNTHSQDLRLENFSAKELKQHAAEQLQQFRAIGSSNTVYADELIYRASIYDEEALTELLELLVPIIRRHIPSRLHDTTEDIIQEVLIEILRRFRSQEAPYIVRATPSTPLASLIRYISIITRNVTINFFSREEVNYDLGNKIAEIGGTVNSTDSIDDELKMKRILELIPRKRDKDIFVCRFVQGMTTDQVVDDLRKKGETVGNSEIYRSIERTIRFLATLPEVRDMFEAG
jgi:DNA-directed RNA polymerase specialized sigma24 family protein